MEFIKGEILIERLIEDDIDTIISSARNGDTAYIYDILYEGIKGYSDWTGEELNREYRERELEPKEDDM